MLEIHNSFNVFMQTLTSTKFVRSELAVETLASPKYGKIILKFMPQTKEKHDGLVLSRSLTFEWYEDDMVFCVFIAINFV